MAGMSFVEFLYKALAEPIGLLVYSENADRFRQKLYAIRREVKDPKLENLALVLSRTNPTNELMIIRKSRAQEA